MVGQSQSTPRQITCGVPQGSNVGPLLFLLFISDFPNCLNLFNFTLFADDTLTAAFQSNETNITEKLNNELVSVNSW